MSCHSVVDEWVSVVRLRVWGVIRWLFYKLSSVIWDYGLSFNGWWMSLLSGIERLRYHSMVVLQVVISDLGLRVVIQSLRDVFTEWGWGFEGSFCCCSISWYQRFEVTGCHSWFWLFMWCLFWIVWSFSNAVDVIVQFNSEIVDILHNFIEVVISK